MPTHQQDQDQQNTSPQSVNTQQDSRATQQEGNQKKNNTGIPDKLKTVVEHFSGFSLDEVRVHYNSEKPAEMGAYAYTEGFDIYIAPGEEKHLAHELWHVVQQMKGEVKETGKVNGKGINEENELENKADKMGEEVLKLAHTDNYLERNKREPYQNKPMGTQMPIQRKITINNKEKVQSYDTVDEILEHIFKQNLITSVQEADAIEEVLEVYHKEDQSFSSIESMLEAARGILREKGKEEEEETMSLGEIAQGKLYEALPHTYGRQGDVQAKMVEITNLVKGIVDEETYAYGKDVIGNGLCGGWVELFMKHPDWVEPVYNAVRSWKRPIDVADVEALKHFENHLDHTTKFAGAENVVQLLGEVYDAMNLEHIEPEAGYDSRPDWTDMGVDDLPISPTFDTNQEEVTFKLRNKKNASKVICKHIKYITHEEIAGECMVHIESDKHHMALRVQKLPTKKSKKLRLLLTVVETEKKGMVKTNNWNEVEKILDSWLSQDEPDLKEIIARTKTVGF